WGSGGFGLLMGIAGFLGYGLRPEWLASLFGAGGTAWGGPRRQSSARPSPKAKGRAGPPLRAERTKRSQIGGHKAAMGAGRKRGDGRVDEASEHVASTFAHPTVEVEPLLLEALDEPAQKPHPDLVLADLVLDAVLEVGVVVDFHHHNAAVGLLEVYAVETVADR